MFNSNGIPVTKKEIVYPFLNKLNYKNHKLLCLGFVLFALNNENEDKVRKDMKCIKTRAKLKIFILMTSGSSYYERFRCKRKHN